MLLDPLRDTLAAVGKRVVRCDRVGARWVFSAISVTRSACCPSCGRRSRRVHGRYLRTLGELPCLGDAVSLEVEVRRFRCAARRCARRTFIESIDPVARRYQRCTSRSVASRAAIGRALGGAAGARLAAMLAMRTSGATLLRAVRRAAVEHDAPLEQVGIDDWAFARGRRHGTIVVDLQRH